MTPAAHDSLLRGRVTECDELDRLLDGVRAGSSGVLVLRGEAGVGKSALLDHLSRRATGFRVTRAAGAESEMEFAFAGLHQLCLPFLGRLDRLPAPQADALGVAFGLHRAPPPNGFLVSLAVLSLLCDVTEEQPLLLIVDDAQWFDRSSTQTLAFVARRLLAERIGLVFAVREPSDEEELGGLDELRVAGLIDGDARALLDSAIRSPVDERVRDRIVAQTRGNPLALLELPRGFTPSELAGGFGLPEAVPITSRIEQGFLRRLEPLEPLTRRLLLTAAADPLGDVTSLWRAAEKLGIAPEAAGPAQAADLLEIGARVRFRHPLVRSAVYGDASVEERRQVHGALAAVIDPDVDPDRRAWHRAQAASSPDEEVALELEHSAGRALTRGGLAAAAAFLERAVQLTPDPEHRAQRALAAAGAKRDAGALDAALGLLAAVEAGPDDPLRIAHAERLRGEIAFDQRRTRDAVGLLSSAARQFERLDAPRARETHLEALGAALWAASAADASGGVHEAARAARAAPPAAVPPRPVDLVFDALALRVTDGFAAAVPSMQRAMASVLNQEVGPDELGRWLWLAGSRACGIIALELLDFDGWRALSERAVGLAREAGALVQLQYALNPLAGYHLIAGELEAAARLIDEDRAIAEATRNPPIAYTAMMLAVLRGREPEAAAIVATISREAAARGQGRMVGYAMQASSLLDNGLGRHEAAREAAARASRRTSSATSHS